MWNFHVLDYSTDLPAYLAIGSGQWDGKPKLPRAACRKDKGQADGIAPLSWPVFPTAWNLGEMVGTPIAIL